MSRSLARWLCSLPAGVLLFEHALFLFLFGAKGVSQFFDKVYKFEIFVCYTSWFSKKVILLEFWIIMASPESLKWQRRGTCGNAMAAFDLHEKCARCHDKKVGDDPCVKGQDCLICEGFTDAQHETLSTPSYESMRTEDLVLWCPLRT